MKVKIISDCIRDGGEVVLAGQVIECGVNEATLLSNSGRAERIASPASSAVAEPTPVRRKEPADGSDPAPDPLHEPDPKKDDESLAKTKKANAAK